MASPGYVFKYNRPAIGTRFQAAYAAQIPLEVKGAPSQTGKLLDLKNSSGTSLASFSSAGVLDAPITATGAVNLSSATVTLPENQLLVASGTITSANITGTSAGQLGHASGVVLVADPGATKVIEFISLVFINDFGVAAYTGGGDTTVNYNGGAAVSAVVATGNCIQLAADGVAYFAAATPTNAVMTVNKGLNLVSASAPTNPGTATGVYRWKLHYRVHTHGL